jgi:hypothetical protein
MLINIKYSFTSIQQLNRNYSLKKNSLEIIKWTISITLHYSISTILNLLIHKVSNETIIFDIYIYIARERERERVEAFDFHNNSS